MCRVIKDGATDARATHPTKTLAMKTLDRNGGDGPTASDVALKERRAGSENDVPGGEGAEESLRVEGDWVAWGGELYYCVRNCHRMAPFLVNVVSDSDLWLFAGSNGAVTGGRRNPDHAIFPYVSQDKLFDSLGTSGPITALHVDVGEGGESVLWEPWSARVDAGSPVRRNLLKNQTGSQLVFEERHSELNLSWAHSWTSHGDFGLLRKAKLRNNGRSPVKIRLLDGLCNLLSPGISEDFYSQFSNLGDAYKKSERLAPGNLGVYYLNSLPTDRAEPSEGLRATVVWSCGLEVGHLLLSARQVPDFLAGASVESEEDLRGHRAAFLAEAEFTLEPGEVHTWWMVAATGLDATAVANLQDLLMKGVGLPQRLEEAAGETAVALRKRVATADGLQATADEPRCWRHFSNTLFNIMRGGVFVSGGRIDRESFRRYLRHFNRAAARRHDSALGKLAPVFKREVLIAHAEATGCPDLIRLAGEYLPLTFSRRHGDPSRPWNRFSIETRDRAGCPVLAYQGNWRDIFQNWEALLRSFPEYSEAVILRFLNASTADGFNPYRISHKGIDWEVPEPDSPWSNIGYWGDHQIVYLLRLLEYSAQVHPGALAALRDEEVFVYADVPYRIRSFEEIRKDARATVDYDQTAARAIAAREEEVGADGRLLHHRDGGLVRASLMDKLLVTLLARLGNFVPDGGIWMNTQRPEWNDANNALAGYGLSVVTLGYLHRYLDFLERFLEGCPGDAPVPLNAAIAGWLQAQSEIFLDPALRTRDGMSPFKRGQLVTALGTTAACFRNAVYDEALSDRRVTVETEKLRSFLGSARAAVRRALLGNRRPDGLWHSYNILCWENDGGAAVEHLEEMLEGQVAILSAGLLNAGEVVKLLEALRNSRLYRDDKGSYLLYPDRPLPTFLEKNRIPEERVCASRLLREMLEEGDPALVSKDCRGVFRFNGGFRNVADLRAALSGITRDEWRQLAAEEADVICEIFEETFGHRRFTGRSTTFFAYEGLGSIYWHMVSKLVLAIAENHEDARAAGERAAVLGQLASHFRETLDGLGMHDGPAEYGAFPIDAYSHTPAQAGAQQPGMTGQVKEDILVRQSELGLRFENGGLSLEPGLLRASEFLREERRHIFVDVNGEEIPVNIPAGGLGFTVCQVPVVYLSGEQPGIEIQYANGTRKQSDGLRLEPEEAQAIFGRTGEIRLLTVTLPAAVVTARL